MRPLCVLATLAAWVLPSAALAGGYIDPAAKAVRRVAASEGTHLVYVRCHRTAPSKFGCRFLTTFYRTGRVGVNYSHGHYYVGEPRLDEPYPYRELPRPCLPSGEICVNY